MGCEVYANNMSIACKAADGKTIAAFPDVCFTPPLTPATPPGVPVPYPNTAMASDTTDGTKTVMISGQEVMLKDKSCFKTSTGDEAGSAPKHGVVTSKIKGKANFIAWSMDVKFEGENVPRHLDLTGHNEASNPPNAPPWPYLDKMAFAGSGPCKKIAEGVSENCPKPKKTRAASMKAMCASSGCCKAMKCVVSPYSPNNCCPDKNGKKPTPHHIVPKSQFKHMGEDGARIRLDSGGKYRPSKGPCICVDGESHSEGDHGDIHAETNTNTRKAVGVESGTVIPDSKRWTVGEAEKTGAEAVEEVTQCPAECIEAQVRKGHRAMGINKSDMIRPTTAGGEGEADSGSGL
jgi:hypothetical protein